MDATQPLTSDQVWEAAQTQLKSQMIKSSYDSLLRNAWLINAEGSHYIIGVSDERSQGWLENRLRSTVERTLSNIAGQKTQVKFQVASRPRKTTEISFGKQSKNGTQNQNGNGVSDTPSQALPQIIAQANYQKGFFEKGGAGYSQWSHHSTHFWMPLLGPAFALYQFLSSQDKRSLHKIAPNYWGPPLRYSYRDLAQKLNRKHPRIISGDAIECVKSRELRQSGTPLQGKGDCCQSSKYEFLRLKKHPKGQGFMCQHWSEGMLEVLHREGLVVVEVREINEQKMYIQTWRMLPLLTPFQYARLSNDLQNDYDQWLAAYGHIFGVADKREWETIKKRGIVPLMPAYDKVEIKDNFKTRKKRVAFMKNAFRNKHYRPPGLRDNSDE